MLSSGELDDEEGGERKEGVDSQEVVTEVSQSGRGLFQPRRKLGGASGVEKEKRKV